VSAADRAPGPDFEGLPALRALLSQPGLLDVDPLQALRATLPPLDVPESWNSAFEATSLFDAWTRSPFTEAVYAANRATLRPLLDARPDWVVLEVGGGDGRLWSSLLQPDDQGTIVLVDPHPEPHRRLAERVPEGVRVVSIRRGVEAATLPEADAVVCSMTLHHLAGTDAAHRSRAGLQGPGKLEVLARFARSLTPRCGVLLLNEADVDCEIDLRPGDPVLREHLADGYVRRCAAGLIHAIDHTDDADLAARWWAIVRRWCLDQLDVADVPLAERDVYELPVPRWLSLLHAAGFAVLDHRKTDDWDLFHRYLCVPAQAWRREGKVVVGL